MITATQLTEKGAALESKRKAAKEFWDGFKAVGDHQAKQMSAEDVAKFNSLMDEVNDLQTDFDAHRKAYEGDQANRKAMDSRFRPEEAKDSNPILGSFKGLAERFMASQQYKSRQYNQPWEDDSFDWKAALTEYKTTMTTTAGWAPFVTRQPGYTPSIQRPVQVVDTLPMRRTNENSIKFMKETTFTNNADAKSETGASGEAALAYTETTSTIERVVVFLPVSEIQLADEAGLQDIIEERLSFMVMQKLDSLCMAGTGTPPEIYGFLNLASVASQAKGTDPVMDAVHKALTKVRVDGRAAPNTIYMHSGDWQEIRLQRTADGVYILGNPTDAGPTRLWGLPVVQTETLTEGTGLVADTMYSTLVLRQGVEIAISNSHASNFISGILAIRATVRAGLEVRRDQAFCKVTGI